MAKSVRSAAVYARISSDQDGTALGVSRQLEDCCKLAASLGWTVGAEYVDNDLSASRASLGRSTSGCCSTWPTAPGTRCSSITSIG